MNGKQGNVLLQSGRVEFRPLLGYTLTTKEKGLLVGEVQKGSTNFSKDK